VLLSKLSYFDNVNASMSPALLAAIHETIKEKEGGGPQKSRYIQYSQFTPFSGRVSA